MYRCLLIAVLLLGACVTTTKPLTADQQLAAVELTFTGLVDQLTEARFTGVITDDQLWSCAKTVINVTDGVLDNAHEALFQQRSIAALLGNIQARVRGLRRLYSTGENICEPDIRNPTRFRRGLGDREVGQRVQRDRTRDGSDRRYGVNASAMGAHHVRA